jgi:hypothetical protein
MSEGKNKKAEIKRAAIVVLISLQREAQEKSSAELKAKILKALEEGFWSMPWVVLEDVIVVQE